MRDVPSQYVTYPPYLEAMEVREEIRHFRPGWLRAFPDPGKVDINLNFHKRLWHIAEHEQEIATAATRMLASLTEARRESVIDTQKRLRKLKQEGTERETTLALGPHVIELGRAASLDDPEAWWRRNALSNWYGAILEGDKGLTDWADYLGGYLDRRAIEIRDFASFWLEDARPEAMPRGFVHFAVVYSQLDHKVERGNLLDADHASASLDADVFVTEDKSLHSVLRTVKRLEARLPEPRLAVRAGASAVAAVETALGGLQVGGGT
ncbi:MAG: hypothetical protein ABSB24_02145 [Gaiellaceae bacterium]